MKCSSSRMYEILGNLQEEDPTGLIKTFVLRSPGSERGTRLFELNSIRRFLAWRFEQTQIAEQQRSVAKQIKEKQRALLTQQRREKAQAKRDAERNTCPVVP